MHFNENSRVKIPAILHLCKIAYSYLSLSDQKWDKQTNIFTDIFSESLKKLNPHLSQENIDKEIKNILFILDYEDLGESFYQKIVSSSDIKYIDFKNPENNSFHVVTELPYESGDDCFRPDITLLINGMPLVFIEVKKPNNQEGILQERNRIYTRFQNKAFRRFINITQLLIFSNNMEYDFESIEPIQGAFYATTSYQKTPFHCFREELQNELKDSLESNPLSAEKLEEIENKILKDNNLVVIKQNLEFKTNKSTETPTNRILTSLTNPKRLLTFLQYGIVYVQQEKSKQIEKHIMRYPQFFATKAIEKTLENGKKKGIIWHTQGSGKTALAYFNVAYLTNYFQNKNTIPKFYFIVDRLDLMQQAQNEFKSRGLKVHTVNSRDELTQDFRQRKTIHNLDGQREITVVNIQKFTDDSDFIQTIEYDLNTQRIYFLDEVHRSYKATGRFLANLFNSDKNAILIGLTGTPLITEEKESKKYLEIIFINIIITLLLPMVTH